METQGKARILLVDDEPALAKLMQTYLSRMGYVVHTSPDAESAFTIVASATEKYHLVVADVTLPGIHGDVMALQMLTENPSLKVLLSSGYPYAVDSLPEPVQARVAFLQKPYLPNMLAKAVEELTQGRTA